MSPEEKTEIYVTVQVTLERIKAICCREIVAGNGRHYCLPMIRDAVDEIEKQFIASEIKGMENETPGKN